MRSVDGTVIGISQPPKSKIRLANFMLAGRKFKFSSSFFGKLCLEIMWSFAARLRVRHPPYGSTSCSGSSSPGIAFGAAARAFAARTFLRISPNRS